MLAWRISWIVSVYDIYFEHCTILIVYYIYVKLLEWMSLYMYTNYNMYMCVWLPHPQYMAKLTVFKGLINFHVYLRIGLTKRTNTFFLPKTNIKRCITWTDNMLWPGGHYLYPLHCHYFPNTLKCSRWECSIAFIDSFQRNKRVFMIIITRRKRLLKQNTTYDANVCMLTNKCSYIIDYQLFETCAIINCNHVNFLMKLDWIYSFIYIGYIRV